MRNLTIKPYILAAAILPLPWHAFALEGQVQIHDPSTVVHCGGKYYTFGTGGTILVSEDGWTWVRGVRPSHSGMAPDVIHIGDRFCLYVARNIGAQPRTDINGQTSCAAPSSTAAEPPTFARGSSAQMITR